MSTQDILENGLVIAQAQFDGEFHQNTQECDFEEVLDQVCLPAHCDYSECFENEVLGIQDMWH